MARPTSRACWFAARRQLTRSGPLRRLAGRHRRNGRRRRHRIRAPRRLARVQNATPAMPMRRVELPRAPTPRPAPARRLNSRRSGRVRCDPGVLRRLARHPPTRRPRRLQAPKPPAHGMHAHPRLHRLHRLPPSWRRLQPGAPCRCLLPHHRLQTLIPKARSLPRMGQRRLLPHRTPPHPPRSMPALPSRWTRSMPVIATRRPEPLRRSRRWLWMPRSCQPAGRHLTLRW